jgi:dUTP pyrophosphatase
MNIVKLNQEAKMPLRATAGSAGFDLYAHVGDTNSTVFIAPHESALIGTGISLEIDEGHFGLLCPRSGLAMKFGITLLNGPGVVDADYRGEIKCLLINLSSSVFEVSNGMRIAQLIIMKYENQVVLNDIGVQHISHTERGERGFGSSGY